MPLIAKVNPEVTEIVDLKDGSIANEPADQQQYWRTVINDVPVTDPYAQVSYINSFSFQGQNVVIEWSVVELPAFWRRYRLKQYATQVRQQKVTNSITALPDGTFIDSSLETRVNLIGAFLALNAGWTENVNWKKSTGENVLLNLTDITGISQLIINHIQMLYTNEQEIYSLIDGDAITTKTQIDSYSWHQ